MERTTRNFSAVDSRFRSRPARRDDFLSRDRDEWSAKCDPRSRAVNRSFRAEEFRQFARAVERDLDPRGPLEWVVVGHAARSAWRLQAGLSADSANPNLAPSATTESAARALSLALATLDLLQDRSGDDLAPERELDLDPGTEEDDPTLVVVSNEWPVVPRGDDDSRCDELPDHGEDATDEPPLWVGRLVYDFDVSDSSPVVRGTWVTVAHIVSLIVDGATWADILRWHPELSEEDIRVCVAYAVSEENAGI